LEPGTFVSPDGKTDEITFTTTLRLPPPMSPAPIIATI